MREAHLRGTPVIRAMFYVFPEDKACWARDVEDQYMFGGKYLVAPVMEQGAQGRSVYLPAGADWYRVDFRTAEGTGEKLSGAQRVEVEARLFEDEPLFCRYEG